MIQILAMSRIGRFHGKRRTRPRILRLLLVLRRDIVRKNGMSGIPNVDIPSTIRRGETSGSDSRPIYGISLRGVAGIDEERFFLHFSRGRRSDHRGVGGIAFVLLATVGTGGRSVQDVQRSADVVEADGAAVAPTSDDVAVVRTDSDAIDSPAGMGEGVMFQYRVQLLFFLLLRRTILVIVLVVLVLPLLPQHLVIQLLLRLLPPTPGNPAQIAHSQHRQLVQTLLIGLRSHHHGHGVGKASAIVSEVSIGKDVEGEGGPFGRQGVVHFVGRFVHFEGGGGGVGREEGVPRFYFGGVVVVGWFGSVFGRGDFGGVGRHFHGFGVFAVVVVVFVAGGFVDIFVFDFVVVFENVLVGIFHAEIVGVFFRRIVSGGSEGRGGSSRNFFCGGWRGGGGCGRFGSFGLFTHDFDGIEYCWI
mmetsp:Transcript_24105/g.50862  ORF Transcript_24105/g.50862 Transcript_24105/m.50862 type:complete len:416 (-) Transcript_24105:168-1415(-)